MKKSIIAIVLAVATLVTFIIPASAWSWKTDGKFEVAAWLMNQKQTFKRQTYLKI